MKGDVKVITCGCRFNRYESQEIKSRLAPGLKGFDAGKSGLVVVNTCAVTKKSEAKSRHAVRRAVRENPDAAVAVAGCWAEYDPDAAGSIEGVDFVLGNEEKFISSTLKANGFNTHVGMVENANKFIETGVGLIENRTAAYLKIQNGCNEECTFCMVRIVRGKSRSASSAFVTSQIDKLISIGAREIVLTGINIGEYGDRPDHGAGVKTDLALILKEAAKRKTARFRLSSINPMEVTDEIMETITVSENICPHLHIPMQSGSDAVLKRMKRPYTAAEYRKKAVAIAKKIPGIALGCDVMAGFPGETESDFNETANLLGSLPFSYAHVFPYSTRPKTAAFVMDDAVPPHAIRERVARLKEISAHKNLAFRKTVMGQTVDVLVETRNADDGKLRGKSDTFIDVVFDGPERLKGEMAKVSINGLSRRGVTGVIA